MPNRKNYKFHALHGYFEIARALLRFCHVARVIVNANHSVM